MIQVYRKEIKYVINKETYLLIKKLLDVLLTPDKHSINGSYIVRSQYYDSLTDGDLFDNLCGISEKRKIRVRIYSTMDDVAKLEYKCKNGTDGIKYSLSLSREEVELMEAHKYDFLLEKNEKLALYLYIKMTQQVYMPKTIVEYERTAYQYPASDVRITYDQNIRGTINPYGIYDENPSYIQMMGEDYGVLEIKYNDFLPDYLKAILNKLDSSASAYSKYSNSRMMYV